MGAVVGDCRMQKVWLRHSGQARTPCLRGRTPVAHTRCIALSQHKVTSLLSTGSMQMQQQSDGGAASVGCGFSSCAIAQLKPASA